jgi:hypothetical protein
VRVTFTRLTGHRYAVGVVRESGPPAGQRVSAGKGVWLPPDIAHFLVEREFGLRLGIFGQLAAGGDAGTFRAAPADRDARLAHCAHRLQVTGRGDLGRSVAMVSICTAIWEFEAGRRFAPPDLQPYATATSRSWGLLDMADVPCDGVRRVVQEFEGVATRWNALGVRESLAFDWPAALTCVPRRSA